jgi:ABC-type oligopeptide transport system substrate-binding subunit
VDAWTWQGIKNRAEYLQAQWLEILGVEIHWKIMDFSQFIHQVDRVPVHMIQTAWMPDYPDPDSVLRASPIRRRAHWQNDAFERVVEKARRIQDQVERLGLYAQADRMMVEDHVVLIPLTYMWSHILIKPWVRRFPASAINEWLWKDFVIEPHGSETSANIKEQRHD